MGASYKVLTGLDYGAKRAEAGEIVSDLPAKSVGWLVEQGYIESVNKAAPTDAAPDESEPESPEMEADE